jgi:hypothetical protein
MRHRAARLSNERCYARARRLARDLPDVDAEEAWRRLERLTAEQRAQITAAIVELGSKLER